MVNEIMVNEKQIAELERRREALRKELEPPTNDSLLLAQGEFCAFAFELLPELLAERRDMRARITLMLAVLDAAEMQP